MSEQPKVTGHLWNDWMGVSNLVSEILGKHGRGESEEDEQMFRELALYNLVGIEEGGEPRYHQVGDRPWFTENIHLFSEEDQLRWKELHQMVLDANLLLERIRKVSLSSLETISDEQGSSSFLRFTRDSSAIPLLKELRELIIKASIVLYGRPAEAITRNEVVF